MCCRDGGRSSSSSCISSESSTRSRSSIWSSTSSCVDAGCLPLPFEVLLLLVDAADTRDLYRGHINTWMRVVIAGDWTRWMSDTAPYVIWLHSLGRHTQPAVSPVSLHVWQRNKKARKKRKESLDALQLDANSIQIDYKATMSSEA